MKNDQKIEMIKLALKEWGGSDEMAIRTCWRIAVILGNEKPTQKDIQWAKKIIHEKQPEKRKAI